MDYPETYVCVEDDPLAKPVEAKEVPSEVQYGMCMLQDEPDEFWECAAQATRDAVAEWLLSDNSDIQESLYNVFGAEMVDRAKTHARTHIDQTCAQMGD